LCPFAEKGGKANIGLKTDHPKDPLFGLTIGNASQKIFLTIPLSGWVCHIAGKVSGSIHNLLVTQSDFTHDEDYLSLFGTSVFMWLTLNEDCLIL
jgi:hypothetical protein